MFKEIRGKGSACIEVASCDIFSIEFHNVMFTQGSQYRRTIWWFFFYFCDAGNSIACQLLCHNLFSLLLQESL